MKSLIDPEKEASLLGCFLLRQDLLDEYNVFDGLFTNDEYKRVYNALKIAKSKGITVDETMLLKIPNLSRDLMGNIIAVSSAANVKYYYNTLKELWTLRELRQLSDDVSLMVNGEPSSKIIETIERSLTGYILSREQGYTKIADHIPNFINVVQKTIELKGQVNGVPTGLHELDQLCNGLQKQDYIIIGARPSQGKTALALTMINAAARAKKKIGFFSAEMGIVSLLRRLVSLEGRIEANRFLSGFLSPSDMQKMDETFTFLQEASIFINDTPNIPLRKLVSEAQKMKRNEDIDILFVDYIGLIGNDTSKPRHEQVAEVSMRLKSLARELDIPVVALSQLTRDAQGQRPQLNQLRDSGQLEADADIIAMLHNEGPHNGNEDVLKYQLIIAKARNYATKDIDLLFYKKYTRFVELKERQHEA